MIQTTCLVCWKPIPVGTSRCKDHGYRRSRSGQPTPSYQEKQRRKAVVDKWIEQHGNICPGWNVEPHPSLDLTADHVIPQSISGSAVGELQVLCRRCNSARGGRNRIPSKKT
jgi:5-methylcytosine-specific restriction enzyme A